MRFTFLNGRNMVVATLFVLGSGLFSFTPTDKYFEIAKNLDIFATMYKEINAYYVDEVNPNKFMRDGIDAMLDKLDPYTNYIPEDEIEDYRSQMTGQYGGIGSIIGVRNDRIVILMPYEGFPAHKAGLQIGDEIWMVDAVDTKGKSTSDVSKLLKGQAGTQVKVKIKRFGNPEFFEATLTREKIKLENVPYYGMVNERTGYIKLSEFMQGASKDIKKSLEDLKTKGAKNIILDLRDNPGGLLHEAVEISNIFIQKDKLIVSTKGKISEWNKKYYGKEVAIDTEIPLVVLTSGRSASASEIVSGVIQDYDRGVIVGQRSFGKGLVQSTRPLTYNSQLKVTVAKYYTPSGRCIQAIDYSNRKDDGTVTKIADSLRTAFKTIKNGRTVYDGGGITPDVEVERKASSSIINSLQSKYFIFDFATEYASKNKSIKPAKEFKLSDEEYQSFVTWLQGKDYDYTTEVEKTLKDLEKVAKEEKYYDNIKDQIEGLRKQVGHSKEKDLMTFKAEIAEVLEKEIVSRYYLQKGILEASFDDDAEIQAALKILENPTDYTNTLLGKK